MMSIGFAGQPGVEQSYALTPSQKDQEFDIKDHGDAGWGLFDVQTGEWLTVVSRSGGREEVRAIGVRRDNAFSRMMAGVVHDTAVLYNDYANSELAVSPAGNKPDTATAQITPVDNPIIKPEALAGAPGRPDSPGAQSIIMTKAHTPPVQAHTPPAQADTPSAQADTPSAQAGVPSAQAGATAKTDPPSARGGAPAKTDTPAAQTGAIIAKPDIATAPTRAATAKPDSQAASGVSVAKANSPIVPVFRPNAQLYPVKSAPLRTSADEQDSVANSINRPNSGASGQQSSPVDSSAHEPLYRPAPTVVKLSERKLTHTMRLVYVDKSREAKTDTVVVIIPLDTPQTLAAKTRNTGSDSSLSTAAKSRSAGPDSSHQAAAKSRNAGPDSSHQTAAKSRSAGADSGRAATARTHSVPDSSPAAAAKLHNTVTDSDRTSAAKSRAVDSTRIAARSKGSNFDSPSNVRVIVPTPVAQPADKNRPNDSIKKSATRSPLPYINSDCHAFATDYDVDKLRVKMLDAAKDEDRIAAALKIFKTKCFYTRQIKALSEVFTNDASKYRFFETAYPFAADEHFRELGALLSDPVYQNKFKTLVH